jgi:octaprenyl-diphosphate synthase
MRSGSAGQGALIRRAIAEGGLADFAPVLAAIRETGALDYVKRQAERAVDRGRDLLAVLPDSGYRNCLLELATFAVTRNY